MPKNHLLLKKLKNTESAQLCNILQQVRMSAQRGRQVFLLQKLWPPESEVGVHLFFFT